MKRLLIGAVAIAILASGCGGGEDVVAQAGGPVEPLDIALPTEVVGLKVAEESVKEALESFRPSYVEGAALYSFRTQDEKELVQATLQIARFRDEPRNRSNAFRQSILTQFGSTRPRTTRMGDVVVYRTTQTKQTVAIWFDDLDWYMLAIRDEFDRPRTLMRETLEVTTGEK